MIAIADVAAGPAILLFGLFAGAVMVLVIALLEAIVLVLVGWARFWRSLIDSLAMNVASTLLGLVLATLAPGLYEFCGYGPAGDTRWCAGLVSPWTLLVLAAVLTVLVEGGVLLLLRRRPARETWRAALACNAVSYLCIAVLMVLGVGG